MRQSGCGILKMVVDRAIADAQEEQREKRGDDERSQDRCERWKHSPPEEEAARDGWPARKAGRFNHADICHRDGSCDQSDNTEDGKRIGELIDIAIPDVLLDAARKACFGNLRREQSATHTDQKKPEEYAKGREQQGFVAKQVGAFREAEAVQQKTGSREDWQGQRLLRRPRCVPASRFGVGDEFGRQSLLLKMART